MRILEFCLSPDFGGLEIHMRDFSSWLHEKENVELFLALQKGSRLHQALEPLKAPGMLFRKSTGKVALSRARSLADFIRINEIDVVHVHWKFDLPVVALARKLSGKKFLFVHTRQMNMPGKKTDPYHRFVYGQLDAFIAITRYIENQAHVNLPIHSDKIFQIYYGFSISSAISHDRIKELKSRFGITGKFTVGLLGRISEYKGQHLLIEAVEQLNREGLPVHAFIVGAPFEPVYCRQLHQMVLDKALQEQVRFIDFYEKPHELMSCFDTVVLTTRKETFGLVLIEAMHAGIPVIGSNAGGVPEIIDHEETGLLFETWNSASLAKCIKQLMDDENLRHKLAKAGMKKARERFDRETQYQKVLNLMGNLTRSREKHAKN